MSNITLIQPPLVKRKQSPVHVLEVGAAALALTSALLVKLPEILEALLYLDELQDEGA